MVSKIFNWLGSHSEKRPVVVLAIIGVLTAVAVFGLFRIKQEFGYKTMLPKNSPSVKAMNEADRVFGGIAEEQVLVISRTPLDADVLRKIAAYPEFLKSRKDIWPDFANDVITPLDEMSYFPGETPPRTGSPQSASDASQVETVSLPADTGAPAASSGEPLLSKIGTLGDAELSEQVRLNLETEAARLEKLGMEGGSQTISKDGKAFLITAKMNPDENSGEQTVKVVRFEDDTKAFFKDVAGESVFINGLASLNKDSSQRTMKDTKLLFILAFVFIIIVLFVTFGRITDVILMLAVIGITIVWVMGLGGLLGFPFTYTSAAIIPLMLGIDIAYGIHVISRYYEERRKGEDPHKSALRSVVTVGVAVFLTAATTAFGFASFGISNMPPIQQFGVLCVAGVMFSFLLSVTLLPATLVLRDRGEKSQEKWKKKLDKVPEGKQSAIDRFLVRIAIVSEHHRIAVFAITAVLIGSCVLLGLSVKTEADMEKMMPKDTPSVVAMHEISKYFGGQDFAYTLVEGDILEPETLNAMLAYEGALASVPERNENGEPLLERSKIFSIADLVQKQAGSIPATKEEVLQVLMGMSTGSKSEQSNRLMNPDYPDITMVTIRVSRGSDKDLKKLAEVLREKSAQAAAGGSLQMRNGGFPLLMNDLLGSIVPTQLKTSVLALILCALIVVMVFGSIFFGLAATSVVFIGIALELGALALLGWPLDFMTVMVSSLVIGAGIDFGIHVTHRFREEWHHGGVEIDEAMRRTIGNVGKALLAAAVTTAGAFLIIAISQVSYLRRFGGITALSLTFALLAALLFLPSVLAWRAGRVEKVRDRKAQA